MYERFTDRARKVMHLAQVRCILENYGLPDSGDSLAAEAIVKAVTDSICVRDYFYRMAESEAGD